MYKLGTPKRLNWIFCELMRQAITVKKTKITLNYHQIHRWSCDNHRCHYTYSHLLFHLFCTNLVMNSCFFFLLAITKKFSRVIICAQIENHNEMFWSNSIILISWRLFELSHCYVYVWFKCQEATYFSTSIRQCNWEVD